VFRFQYNICIDDSLNKFLTVPLSSFAAANRPVSDAAEMEQTGGREMKQKTTGMTGILCENQQGSKTGFADCLRSEQGKEIQYL
jgi:hypothetical protein